MAVSIQCMTKSTTIKQQQQQQQHKKKKQRNLGEKRM